MPDLLSKLRDATSEAHERLESHLDLLREPLSRERFIELLSRFYGFHAAWDPAVEPWMLASHQPGLAARALTRDLDHLGETAPERLPICAPAARLAGTAEAALGSSYVMVGSALGGKVINRSVMLAPWSPPGGLSYFDRYGASTGVVWRAFGEGLRNSSSARADPLIIAGALATFSLLDVWLAGAA
jgi:heme oxygenase